MIVVVGVNSNQIKFLKYRSVKMIVGSVSSLSSQKVSSFPPAKVSTNASLAPAFGNESTALRQAPSMARNVRRVLAALVLGAAAVFATSCANPSGPTPTPIVDPTPTPTPIPVPVPVPTPAQETATKISDTLGKLNPIIVDSSATLQAKDVAPVASAFKGFSYEAYGTVEDFMVKSVDEVTGIITATHTSTNYASDGTSISGVPEDVTLAKTADGFTVTHANGGQEKFALLDVAVQRTTGSVVRNLQKGAEQGEVLVSDLAGKLMTTFENFKLKK